jgi:hypothetical protein
MSADLRQPHRSGARHTYFVGRRPSEAPEVYAVTDDDVRRLRPNRRGSPLALDWHAGDARAVELSHLLLTSVTGHRPARDLEQRFALDVLRSPRRRLRAGVERDLAMATAGRGTGDLRAVRTATVAG